MPSQWGSIFCFHSRLNFLLAFSPFPPQLRPVSYILSHSWLIIPMHYIKRFNVRHVGRIFTPLTRIQDTSSHCQSEEQKSICARLFSSALWQQLRRKNISLSFPSSRALACCLTLTLSHSLSNRESHVCVIWKNGWKWKQHNCVIYGTCGHLYAIL